MAVLSIFDNMLFKIYFTSKEYLFFTFLLKKVEYHLKKITQLIYTYQYYKVHMTCTFPCTPRPLSLFLWRGKL